MISLFIADETTHENAKYLYKKHSYERWHALSLVSYEVATVLSRKYGHSMASGVIKALRSLPLLMISHEEFEEDIWSEFLSYEKKNISFVDCANMVIAKRYNLKIASFDRFYPKSVLIA